MSKLINLINIAYKNSDYSTKETFAENAGVSIGTAKRLLRESSKNEIKESNEARLFSHAFSDLTAKEIFAAIEIYRNIKKSQDFKEQIL